MSLQDSISFFLSQSSSTDKSKSNEDSETVDMEASENGGEVEGDEYGSLTKHPSYRKRRSNRQSLFILAGFCMLMMAALIPMSKKKKKKNNKNINYPDELKENVTLSNNNADEVFCHGQGAMPYDDWLDQDLRYGRITDLCDPDFRFRQENVDMGKPVQVFILMGESNMVGAGQVHGEVEGTLSHTVRTKKRFTHLVDYNKKWKKATNVRYLAVEGDMEIKRDEWLGVNVDDHYFGPELQFGYVVRELVDGPVLLLKVAVGQHSLGGDFLPPGSSTYEFGGLSYPGYGQGPRRWPSNTNPNPSPSWRAGHSYDETISNIKTVLNRIEEYYPGSTEYNVAGIAYWQGDTDRRDTGYAIMYQKNLRNLIGSIRKDLDTDVKVAIASIGQFGYAMQGNAKEIFDSQMAMGSLYKDFQGNVLPVDIRASWRGKHLPGSEETNAVHYGHNAETYMEVGNALGLAMAKLLHGVS